MGRILAVDYGTKRTGLAVTDELQIIASGLTTVETKNLLQFLKDYLTKEKVEKIVVGCLCLIIRVHRPMFENNLSIIFFWAFLSTHNLFFFVAMYLNRKKNFFSLKKIFFIKIGIGKLFS